MTAGGPSPPLFLLAPGAGASSSSAWMTAWTRRISSLGKVVPFDYPYMRDGRKAPDRRSILIAAHRRALADARVGQALAPVVLVGKSMGSRIGCHAAVEEAGGIAALICFGYPLRSGATGALRDEVLFALRTPLLFVQGTRDPLCSLDELAAVRARMTAPTELLVVEGGNHSLEVGGRQLAAAGETQDDVNARILGAVDVFVRQSVLTP